jgi:hypothetical protein
LIVKIARRLSMVDTGLRSHAANRQTDCHEVCRHDSLARQAGGIA